MPTETPQSYANHVKKPVLAISQAIGYVVCAALAVLGLIFTGSIMGTCLIGTSLLIMAAINISLVMGTRLGALVLQDRIIRLEMQLRLERVLPDDLRKAAKGLSIQQQIALRFASDEELPNLVRQVLDEGLTKGGEIKQRVKDWQADHQRV